jgi:ABC-type glutathione transport system ATPase component
MDVDQVVTQSSTSVDMSPSLEADLAFDPYLKANAQTERTSFAVSSAQARQINLRFDDVRYEVDTGKGKNKAVKPILKGISGGVNAGEILSVMGASGAGKTTFLNMVSPTVVNFDLVTPNCVTIG